MKKRLLSALLALALVFVLLPTTALAEVTTGKDYDISINGKGWKFEKDTPVYFYGYDPSNYFFSTTADHQWTTNSNLMLTKEGNTVTITIRPSKYHPYESPQFTLKKESTSTEKNDVPCIEMGNGNNLVITGKGTLNITRNESKSRGAALYSDVGDITINGGITVNVSFLNGKDYNNKNVSSNAIYVGDNHNLTVSGSGTNVTATNQGFDSSPATVCVEGGTITVSGGASLSATNTYDDNRSGSDDVKIQHFNSYAISGTKSNPCTLIVADEKSSVTATTNDFTNIAESWAFKYTTIQAAGATIKAGSSASNSTVTTIDNISGQRYAKISVPALQKTSDVLIAGKDAVVGVETSIPSANGSGTYFYDQASKTLTLKDVNIASSSIINGIQFTKDGTYTINLVGTNTMSGFSTGISANSADQYVSNINITITGAGSLEVSTTSYAIAMNKGDLKFENTGAIKLATGKIGLNNNALSVKGNITITDMSKYSVTGTQQTGGKPLGSEVSLTEASQLKGGTTGYRIITITPAAAKDSTISYNRKTLKQGETIRNGGTATVDSKNNTITLKNFNGTAALSFDATLADSTLVLEGTNTLSSIVTTQKGLTISGPGSLTVGSIKVHKEKSTSTTGNTIPNLTINGATVTVGNAEITDRAIDIDGDLTVTNGSLTATSKSDSVPTVQVGGNATFTGSTVTITNNSTTEGSYGVDSNAASSALHVNGAIDISGGEVTATATAGGDAIRAVGNITVSNGAQVTAKNNAKHFSTITAGQASGGVVSTAANLIVSGEGTKIHAQNNNADSHNLGYGGAIYAKIKNANESNYLNITGCDPVAPNDEHRFKRGTDITITRGDEVTRTNSPVVIAGTTLLNDTYYTINGSKVAEGTDSNNYNAFYDSETKTLKLNNASINGTGVKAIEANVGGYTFTIELVGNNIIKTSGSANNVIDITGNLYFTGSGTAEVSGKGTPIYATYKIDVSADVTITNTEKAGSFTFSAYGENSSNYKGANTFAIGTGYTAYATTDKTTWAVYDNTTASENESYTTLRITTQTLETGGSTHQHTYDQSAWKSDATHHWQECTDPNCPDPTKGITNKASHIFSNGACTVCGYRGQTEEHHFSTDWTYDETHHWHACTDDGCTAIKDKAPHEWTGWRIDEPSPGMHNRFCNCGYNDYSHHYNLVYAAAGEAGHYQYCTLGNCTFKTSTVPHNYDGDTCTICNYTKSGEIVPPTPDNPGTIVIIRPAEEEKPAQQPNPSTGANDLVGLAVAAAVAAALGSAVLLRKHD